MPTDQPSSEQLHCVVELSAGIRDDLNKTNVSRLKEALSSKTAFQKYYLVMHKSSLRRQEGSISEFL